MAHWPSQDQAAEKGSILLFPGRTEYIEKYGRIAAAFAARGHATVVIDWRGQGLTERPRLDRMVGYVKEFYSYQKDLAAVLAKLDELGLPKPSYLVSHSMGGCIALRSLLNGLQIKAAAFSAPMWGIQFAPGLGPIARLIAVVGAHLGMGLRYAPGTGPQTYVNATGFAGNMLTRDPETFGWLQSQAVSKPELTLGGPSLQWLNAALCECHALRTLAAPPLPAICFLGESERIVDPAAIHARMAHWSSATLTMVPEAEHEIMMEIPATRNRFLDATTALFATNP
ncbi:alpha/beta fold hydrolase [Pseudorhodobacter sp.]|uniref:alpha/beta fold hydrolase n=1 Tax=Pseudorhodobacter sp. TaxID=1934400 RepID=UPI0026481183|nr:alpha/beta hydrolase [Pseudorhodobacter sp.]